MHTKPQYVVIPRNEKLGEHLETFGGVLGSLEERPGSGFAGSKKIEDSEKFYKALDSSPQERSDAQVYLTARLLDILMVTGIAMPINGIGRALRRVISAFGSRSPKIATWLLLFTTACSRR
ncbi:MAG: hypothetical protein ACRENG_16790 [bacterium]